MDGRLTNEQALEQTRLIREQGWDTFTMWTLATGFIIENEMMEAWLQHLRDQQADEQEEWDRIDDDNDLIDDEYIDDFSRQ